MSSSDSLEAQIARIDAKLDGLVETVDEIKELAAATNGRVRALERWRERFRGAAVVLGSLVGVVSAVASGTLLYLITGA